MPSHLRLPAGWGSSPAATPRAPGRSDLVSVIGKGGGHLNGNVAERRRFSASRRSAARPDRANARLQEHARAADTLSMGSGTDKLGNVTPFNRRLRAARSWTLAATLGLFVAGCETSQVSAPTNYGVTWTRITSSAGLFDPYFPDWRGNRIVLSYRVGSYRRLATMRPDGTDVTYLSAGSSERNGPARWVDDSTIVYASDRGGTFDLWLRVLSTDQIQQLTAFPGTEFDPALRPGTTALVYTDGSEFNGRVVLIPDYLAATPEQYFLTPVGLECGQVDWDPAGQRVCFTADSANARHVWMVTLAAGDSTPVKLTSGPFVDSGPRFSPDGTRLLFASDKRTGRPGVWTIAASGDPSTMRVVAFDDIGAISDTPCWSPSGTEVVVSSNGRGFGRCLWRLSNLP